MTQLHVGTYILTPFIILVIASLFFAFIQRNDALGKFYIESAKLAVLKPLLSLSAMFVLRNIIELSPTSIIALAILSFGFMLSVEVIKERTNISATAVIYNLAALFLLIVGSNLYSLENNIATAPIIAGASFGVFSMLLYSSSKTDKLLTLSDDLDLFSRFEELVDEGQFQTAVDLTEDGLWEFQLESDTMVVSRPLQNWLSLENNTIGHAAEFWINRVHPQDWSKLPESWIPEDFQALRKKIRSLSKNNNEFEIRLKCENDTYKWVRVRFQVVTEGSHTHLHGSFKDVDHEKHANAQITQLSLYDVKTGLPNFSSMLNHLNEAIEKGEQHAILSLNIDNFKIINDLMGFFTGDEVLGKISKRLMAILPEHAHLFRFGGDEFVIVTDQPSEAVVLAELIKSEFNGKLNWKETHLRITCSIGISHFPTSFAIDVESILRCSDIALENAKSNGKNQYAIFNNNMMEELEQRHHLINALENSHLRENFEIYYQPLKHQEGKKSIHVEALLRWTWNGKKDISCQLYSSGRGNWTDHPYWQNGTRSSL